MMYQVADIYSVRSLQAKAVCCNLQTARKLNLIKNRWLHQFADCRPQIAESTCKLGADSIKQGVFAQFPVCTQTPSPYGRGEPQREALHPEATEWGSGSDAVMLCLDLGTTSGWAICSADGLISSGSTQFQNERWQGAGMRFIKFAQFLKTLHESAGPIQMVFFEEVRRHLGVAAAHAYGGYMAHLTAWCEHHGIAYESVPVGTIKRHATGKGNASKAMMIAAAQARGHEPVDDNEADALALLYWAMEHRQGGL